MTTEQKAATGRTDDDDLVDRIDAATADAESDDVKPGSMEARLRLALPGHTYFQKSTGVSAALRRLLTVIGADAEIVGDVSTAVRAAWSTPTGLWSVKTQQCQHSGDEVYHVKIDGPDTEMERDDLTQDQVIELLGVVGAITRTI